MPPENVVHHVNIFSKAAGLKNSILSCDIQEKAAELPVLREPWGNDFSNGPGQSPRVEPDYKAWCELMDEWLALKAGKDLMETLQNLSVALPANSRDFLLVYRCAEKILRPGKGSISIRSRPHR